MTFKVIYLCSKKSSSLAWQNIHMSINVYTSKIFWECHSLFRPSCIYTTPSLEAISSRTASLTEISLGHASAGLSYSCPSMHSVLSTHRKFNQPSLRALPPLNALFGKEGPRGKAYGRMPCTALPRRANLAPRSIGSSASVNTFSHEMKASVGPVRLIP